MIILKNFQFNKEDILKKNRDKLLQKQNDYGNERHTDDKNLLRLYVDLENRLKECDGMKLKKYLNK